MTLLLRIPPAAFMPPPKVWSAVVGLVPHAVQPAPGLFAHNGASDRGGIRPTAQDAARRAEAARRRGLLRAADIAPERRAETLTVAEFDRLARSLDC